MSELASKSGLLSRLAPLRLIGWGSLWDTSCLNLGLQLLAKVWSLLLHRGLWISWRWWEQDTVPDVTCDLKQNPLEIFTRKHGTSAHVYLLHPPVCCKLWRTYSFCKKGLAWSDNPQEEVNLWESRLTRMWSHVVSSLCSLEFSAGCFSHHH